MNSKLPWEINQSIYLNIKENLDDSGRLPEDYDLPDNEEYFADAEFAWVPGALEGISFLHGLLSENDAEPADVITALLEAIKSPSEEHRLALYTELMKGPILNLVPDILAAINQTEDVDGEALHQEARWLADHAYHREAVKMGLVLLTLCAGEADLDLLQMLGRCDEFTWYVLDVFKQRFAQANDLIFELSQLVSGWGKIACVTELEATSPQIRRWLLTDGCQNSIMDEYLAAICAEKGQLNEALQEEVVERSLYKGAGTILYALLDLEGPARDIYDVVNPDSIILNYLRHSARHCYELDDLLVILSIREFMLDQDEYAVDAPEKGWVNSIRRQVGSTCEDLIFQIYWPELIEKQLNDTGFMQYQAFTAARRLGMDIWPQLYALLAENPLDDALLYEILRDPDQNRKKQVIDLVQEPWLTAIESGSPEDDAISSVFSGRTRIFKALETLPGHGGQLIMAGLRSPSSRINSSALAVLQAWSLPYWPPGAQELVENLLNLEKSKEAAAQVLNIQGSSCLERGEIGEAAGFFRRIIENGLEYSYAWFNLGICHQARNEIDLAIECYQHALDLEPEHYKALHNIGSLLGSLERHEEAVECLWDALAIDASQVMTWFNLGWNLDCLGRHQEAIYAYDEAIALDSADFRFPANKARALNCMDNYEDALYWADRALIMNPEDEITWCNKGFTLMYLKRYEEAVRCFDRYLCTYPDDFATLSDKARCLEFLGKHRAARLCWCQVMKIRRADEAYHRAKASKRYAIKDF